MTLAATVLATAVALSPMPPRAGRITPTQAPPRVVAEYGKLPLHFEPNLGQMDEQVRFLARGSGYGLFLTPTESVLVLRKTKPAVLRMKLLGGNPRAAIAGKTALPGKSNYFIGNDPKKWRTNVPNYARVEYEEVYPGVDLAYYGNQGQIEYDFVVSPGADPRQIRLGIEGALSVRLDGVGNLVLSVSEGEVVQKAPMIYQELGAARSAIEGRFILHGPREVGFEVGAYDVDRPLVLDPLLVYSTYLGGSEGDQTLDVAVDASGSVYVVGQTFSTDFPVVGALQPANGGGPDAFVAKFNPLGSALVYATYLGGIDIDGASGIAVDTHGNVYLAGDTFSADFPTVNPLQPVIAGSVDGFAAKLDAAGSGLLYSTYLGGSSIDVAVDVAVDGIGSASVVGYTFSADFPTANAFQAVFGGAEDVFVAKLNAAGSAFVYSTYLGGDSFEAANGVAVDASGNTHLTGATAGAGGADFPTANAFQPLPAGALDAFVTKLNPAGSALVYSTYLGGFNDDSGSAIAVDAAGNVYVTGSTRSPNFPTVNSIQDYGGGANDAYLAKFNASGSALVYSTYLGGSGEDEGRGIAVDASGNAYITGLTVSTDLPTAQPLQAVNGGGSSDGFVMKLDAAGSARVYSTYLGGSEADHGTGIGADASGNAYVTGRVDSPDFPLSDPFQASRGGCCDGFVAKIGPGTPPPNDFNADGQVDILWRDQGSSGHIAVWFMDVARMTHGRLANPSPFPLLNWQIVGTGDFDRDGRTDILWRDQASSGQMAVWFMDGARMKSGTLTNPAAFPLLNWRIVGTGDFNADGKPDILWRDQQSTGKIAVWFMDGTTRTGAVLTDPPEFPLLNWEIVGTGDFDSDGKTDILWRDTKSTGQIAVWFMDGTTMTSATLTDPAEFPLLNWEIQAVGDYDDDGKPDILWRDQQNTGKIALWFMDGITRKSATLTSPDGFPILSWRIVGPK